MRVLHFDCSMGAAGDMLTAALLELFDDREAVVNELNALGIPEVRFTAEPSVKCGITGTHMRVDVRGAEEHEHPHGHEHHHHDHDHEHPHDHEHEHDHHDHEHHHDHAHRSMADVTAVVNALQITDEVRAHVLAVYESIAAAESAVHGVSVTDIHFHEVGSLDAIADVTAAAYLLAKLRPERITASPVHVGSGHVHAAHGILPVPAPATALILRGVPVYGGEIKGELCTPTGAALLKHFVSSFGPMPLMTTEKIGSGMGKKDFPAANCVRAFWGTDNGGRDEIVKLECNVDDMTAEDVGYACEVLRRAGARDVFTTAVMMKKDRPGVLISVLCAPAEQESMAALLLRHTTTIGVRVTPMARYVLTRSFEEEETPYGVVRKKISEGYGVRREKLEFDDLSRIAAERGLSLEELRRELH